jgi:hypothetical protein
MGLFIFVYLGCSAYWDVADGCFVLLYVSQFQVSGAERDASRLPVLKDFPA